MTPTGRRLRTVGELQEILARVRADGFAENHEETAAGLYTASVPIHNERGTVLAADDDVRAHLAYAPRPPGRHPVRPDRRAASALSRDVAWLPSFNAKRR